MVLYLGVVQISHMVLTVIMIMLMQLVGEKRYSDRIIWMAGLAGCAVISVLNTVNQAVLPYSGLLFFIENILQIALLHLLYQGKLEIKALVVLLTGTAYLYLDYLILICMNYLISDIVFKRAFVIVSSVRTVYLLLFSVLFLILGCLAAYQKERFRTLLSAYQLPLWVLIVFAYILSKYFQRVYAVENLSFWEKAGFWYFLFMGGIVLSAAIIYAEAENRIRKQAILLKSETYEKCYREMQSWYQEHSVMLHDLKNHLRVMRQMAVNAESTKLISYIDTLEEPFHQMNRRTKTGISMLNLLIDAKREEAERLGISFRIDTEFLPRLNVPDVDLCAIFGNLLDNAVEACEKEEAGKPYIEIHISGKSGFFIFDIRNSIAEKPLFKDGVLATTKKEKEFHGLGLFSVQKSVQKNNGEFAYEISDTEFHAFVLLPLPIEAELGAEPQQEVSASKQ